MYLRLLLNLCKRSSYRVSNGVRSNVRRFSHIANKDEEKQKVEIVSTRFPDYKVIYTLPLLKQACSINVVKHRFTIFTAVATPVIVGLHLTSVLSLDAAIVSITTGVLMTGWLHFLGILCNNLVGYIYLKLDEEKVILSYIDYWGKRIDLKASLNEIFPLSENPISITDPLYRKIMFSSQKQTLKINVKFGRIMDYENFRCILGTV